MKPVINRREKQTRREKTNGRNYLTTQIPEGFDADALDPGTAAGFAGSSAGELCLGALTPAISEPNPNFCSDGASSFPLPVIPRDSWNRRIASCVPASHFPLGSP